jgi:cystathionine beta-lyase/cystathionine gamma-synthase
MAAGMAAISSTLMAICNSGDHIVCSSTVYGQFALGWIELNLCKIQL